MIVAVAAMGLMLAAAPAPAPAKAPTAAEVRAKLVAAVDPATGPPVQDAVFPKPSPRFRELAPIGPYFPERAQRFGLEGLAVIQCKAEASGRLKGCELVADGPVDFAFGLAALRMAEVGYMTVAPPAEGAVDQPVRVLVHFPKPR